MLVHKIETPIESANIKFTPDNQGIFEGYASVWGRVDAMGDTVVKGAFSETLEDRERPPLMLYQHQPGRVVGIWTEMREDDYGLWVKGQLTPGHTDAANIYASLRHGAISGLSIGFMLPEGGSDMKEDGGRVLKRIDLREISIVSMPAEDNARIGDVKSEIEALEDLRGLERWLRDAAGFSGSQAKCFLAKVKQEYQRDVDRLLAEVKAQRKRLAQAELAQMVNNSFKRGSR